MIIEKVKNFFLRQQLRRNVRSLKKQTYRPISKIKTVGVILDDKLDINNVVFERFSAYFGVSKVNIKFLIFTDLNQEEIEHKSDSRSDYLNVADFDFFGNIKSETPLFYRLKFDILINYFDEANPYLELMSSKYKRCFRLGFLGADEGLNDLIFDFKATNTNSFLNESKKYLGTIFKI